MALDQRRPASPAERMHPDKESGATTNRALQAVLGYARAGDVIVADAPEQLGRTVRDAAAVAKGRCIGRPSVVDPDKLAYAAHLRDTGATSRHRRFGASTVNPDRSAGHPDIDPLIALAKAEQTRLEAAVVIGRAEGVVAQIRQEELLAQQEAAHRQLSAAQEHLTLARKDGSAERIAVAARQVQDAYAEAQAVSQAAIRQIHNLSNARLEQLADTMQQIHRSWAASTAVLNALRHPDPPSHP